MDDPLNVQRPVQPKSNQPDIKNRVEPQQPDDKEKFAKKVDKKLGSKVDDEEEGSLVFAFLENGDDKEDTSIFSLARKNAVFTPKEEQPKESLATGQNKIDITGFKEKEDLKAPAEDDDQKDSSQNNAFSFGQETRQDLFQFIPQSQVRSIQAPEFVQKPTTLSKQEAADLATQMIEKMTVMKTKGETTTELTLKFPPLFQGTIVQIKETATAPGQFNLSFQNLTAQAKQLIDQQNSNDTLKQTLLERGYNVHIIVATTQIEKPEPTNFNSQEKDQQQQGRGGGQQQQQQQKNRQQQ